MNRLLLTLLAVACSLAAQSIPGTWKWDLSHGNSEYVATLKISTDASGSVTIQSGRRGSASVQEYAISDGSISGNALTFTVLMPMPNGPMAISYTGVVSGDSMALTIQYPGRDGNPPSSQTATASRVSQ